jgi:ankyrin repeat protein
MSLSLFSCGKKAREHGPQVPKDSFGESQTTLAEETHKELQAAIIINDLGKFKSLLDSKSHIDLNIQLPDGETLMTTAIKNNRFQYVELLIENSASINRTNASTLTPLMMAAKLGLQPIARLLVSIGANLDTKNIEGNTALHLAILNCNEDTALFLINRSINIDITNNDNLTALKLAEIKKLERVITLLTSLTQTSIGLPEKLTVRNMVLLGNTITLNQLFAKYPSLVYEYKDLNYFVLIINSHAHDKALSMTQLLLSYGADLNGPAGASETPLIEAVKKNYEDFVALMLKENVNPNVLDASGKSALIWAIMQNNQPIVKLLIGKNALEKYTYDVNGKKKTMKACDVARDVRKKISTTDEKKANEDILDLLGCGLRWLF